MKYVTLLAALLGGFIWLVLSAPPQVIDRVTSKPIVAMIEPAAQTVTPTGQTAPVQAPLPRAGNSVGDSAGDSADDVAPPWQAMLALSGQPLQMAVEQWLQICEVQTCVESSMPEPLTALIKDYQSNLQARDEALGQLILPHATQLQEKIAAIKAIDEKVWGDNAMWLYADQYALYDWQLTIDQLDHNDPEMLIASLPNIPSLQTGQQRYEFLLRKLPSLGANAKAELAKQLLTLEQQQTYDLLAQAQVEQQQMVARYQQALAELEHQLMQQRNKMSQADWLSWRNQQLQSFKRDFFASGS